MIVKGAGKSHIGKVREQNQDTIFVNNRGLGVLPNLYVVADGLGGHQSGEVASRKATEAFCDYFSIMADEHSSYESPSSSVQEFFLAALRYANERVFQNAANVFENRGMGTTFSAATIENSIINFVHVGDSRIYLVKENNTLEQITNDHVSVTTELLKQGLITQEEAKKYPETVLSRAIGTDSEVKIDIGAASLNGVKYVILCSDGLHNMLIDDEITKILENESDLEFLAEKLVVAANMAGGRDNISVIVIRWGETL